MTEHTAPNSLVPIFNENKFLEDQFVYYPEGDKRYFLYPDKNKPITAAYGKDTTVQEGYFYLRWTITKTFGVSNSMQVAEFKLYNGDTEINLNEPYIEIGTFPPADSPSTQGIDKLTDGLTSTKFLDFNFVVYGFTRINIFSGDNFFFDSYTWATANDVPDRDPSSWTLEISADNVNWKLIDQRDNYVTINNQARQTYQPKFYLSIPITTPTQFPYPYMTSASNSRYAVDASSSVVGTAGWFAFDGIKTNFWHSTEAYSQPDGFYVGSTPTPTTQGTLFGEYIQFRWQNYTDSIPPLNRLVIYPRDEDNPTYGNLADIRSPCDFVIVGYNGDAFVRLAEYTNVGVPPNDTLWSTGPKEFIFPNTQTYFIYRIVITRTGALPSVQRVSVQINEIMFFSPTQTAIFNLGKVSNLNLAGRQISQKVDEWGQFSQSVVSQQPTYVLPTNDVSYIQFDRTQSQFLSTPLITMNVGTNGGFSFIFRVMFISTPGNYERVFSFSHGIGDRMCLCYRYSTTDQLGFLWRTGTTINTINVISPAGFIVQNEWMNVWLVYNASSATFEMYKNGVLSASQTGINTAEVVDRNTPVNNIGRSLWSGDAYSFMNLQGFLAYDRGLTNQEFLTATEVVSSILEPSDAPSNPVVSLTSRELYNKFNEFGFSTIDFGASQITTTNNGFSIQADNTPLLYETENGIENSTYTLLFSSEGQTAQHEFTRNPDGNLRISNYSLMLGGENNTTGQQLDSGEITAGIFGADRLVFVGVSPDTNYLNRKVRILCDGGLDLIGGSFQLKWFYDTMSAQPYGYFLDYGSITQTITLTGNITTYTWTNLPFNFYFAGTGAPLYFETTIYPTEEMLAVNPTLVCVPFNDVDAIDSPLRTIILAYDGGSVPTGIPFEIRLTWVIVGY